jgi:hypothetical protein
MASFTESAYLARYPTFVDRVMVAMVSAAQQIGEEAQSVAVDHFRLRRALATNVLGDPDGWAPKFALAVVTNQVITLASSDSDIQFTVNSMWDSIAGAGPVPTTG